MKKIIPVVVAILIVAFYVLYMQFEPLSVIRSNSYAVYGNQLQKNLETEELDHKKATLPALAIHSMDTLYQRQEDLFVGEKKKQKINSSYPLFLEDGTGVVNMSASSKLIDAHFDRYVAYPNLTMVAGGIYNEGDYERADPREYLFLALENGLYINSFPIIFSISGEEKRIPSHAVIRFQEDQIKYYQIKEGSFYYTQEVPTKDTVLKVGSIEVSYEELLQKLDIVEPEEVPKPTSSPSASPSISPTPSDEPEEEYQKAQVSTTDLEVGVYSARGVLSIKDTSTAITKPVTFTFYKNGKVYLRKSYLSSGNYEIRGLEPSTTYQVEAKFIYKNEAGKEIENIFYKKEITTQAFDTLDGFQLAVSKGDLFSKRVSFSELQIIKGLDTESVKGVKKILLKIGEETFRLSVEQMNDLLSGKKIPYETYDGLKADTRYHYQFEIWDNFGNSFNVQDGTGEIMTAKEIPRANIQVVSNDIASVELEVELTNPNRVSIGNYRYVVYDQQGQVVRNEKVPNEEKITLNHLDADTIYTIEVFGDFDIADGKGVKKDQKLGETRFTSMPLSSLGFIRVFTSVVELTPHSATLKVSLNKEAMDHRLIELLSTLKIDVLTTVDGKDEIIYTKVFENAEIERLKAGEELTFPVELLLSSTVYHLDFSSKIAHGTKKYDFSVLSDLKKFTTYKKDAKVYVTNQFVTGNMIDFDVQIIDEDFAIMSTRVLLEIRNQKGTLVAKEILAINDDPKRLTYTKLEEQETYTLTYIAEEYNIGFDNATFEENKVLYKNEVKTEPGIFGTLGLEGLGILSKTRNLFDMNNETRWRESGNTTYKKEIDAKTNTIHFYCAVNWSEYSYYLPEYKNQTVTLSFQAKYTGAASPYLKIGNNYTTATFITINDLTTEYKEYSFTLSVGETGYVSFMIDLQKKAEEATVDLKDVQIELGDQKTPYQEYQSSNQYRATLLANLKDLRKEIVTNDYFIKVYKNGRLEDTHKYDLQKGNQLIDQRHRYEVEERENYLFELSVKIRDRFYTLSEVSFTTEQEIHGIRTTEDFFAMTPSFKYVVLEDLDFTAINKSYALPFYGKIDFQGHKVTINVMQRPSSLLSTLSAEGSISNLDLHVYLDNPTERSGYHGFITTNHGTIRNVMITLEESTAVPNTVFSTFCYTNNGTIENFVIHSKAALHVERFGSLLSLYNNGLIQNGYAYGVGMEVGYPNSEVNKRVGTFAGQLSNVGQLKNVYSLIAPSTYSTEAKEQVGNLVGYGNSGTLENCYSYGDGINRSLTQDPNIGLIGSITGREVYYISKDIYDAALSLKTSSLSLWDPTFQNRAINRDAQFEVDDLVSLGYFPQVKLSSTLPNQEFIPLPEVHDQDLVDITSVEVLETQEASAKIKLYVHNPNLEKITKVDIKNLTTHVLSQTDSKGKSEVVIEVTNPIKYVSSYDLRAITSVGSYGIPYVRNYQEKERVLMFELYRQIKTVDDWKKIKENVDENYRLMNDLDFKNATQFQVKALFRGKIDGAGHTIRNIEVGTTGMFSMIDRATIKNLHVENFKKTGTDFRGAFIAQARMSTIDNVHIKNASVISSGETAGLIANAGYSTISNCSVTNLKTENFNNGGNYRVGGLLAVLASSIVQNCYVQEIDIDITNISNNFGVGGLIGATNSGSIDSTYAIGKIKTNSSLAGGFVGVSSGTLITRSYALVDIVGMSDLMGGIVGRETTPSSKVSNCISFGNVYTPSDYDNIHRISGNLPSEKSNYAWNMQKIKGAITNETNGEKLLTTEELKNPNVYTDVIGFGPSFDYSSVSQGEIPKLYMSNEKQYLPNQQSHYLKEESFVVEDIQVEQRVEDGLVSFTFSNPEEYPIDRLEIEGLDIIEVRKNITQNRQTFIELHVKPNLYFDSYRLSKLYYRQNDQILYEEKENRIKLQFYKNLEKFEDWQKISTNVPENYRLIADIDFRGKVNINTNVLFNRLEGAEDGYRLKNITLENQDRNFGFIRSVISNISNVTFSNITLTTQQTGAYFSIISIMNGNASYLRFEDIRIDAPLQDSIGCIGIRFGGIMQHIDLKNINVIGRSRVGGLYGDDNLGNVIRFVTGDQIQVKATGSYVGGIFGTHGYIDGKLYTDFDVSNVTVVGNESVGGISGYGTGERMTIRNSTITGSKDVGGISGNNGVGFAQYLQVENVVVTGSKESVGGLVGNGPGTIEDSYVIDAQIIGTAAETTYVAGLRGSGSGVIKNCGVVRTEITSKGDSVGGMIGIGSGMTIQNSFVAESKIVGRNHVGGIAGSSKSMHGLVISIHADIIGTGKNTGGAIGYIENRQTTLTSNITRLQRIMILQTHVSGTENVSGYIGYADKAFYEAHYNAGLVDATVTSTSDRVGVLVGNNDLYSSVPLKQQVRVYDQMKVNEVAVKDIPSHPIPETNLLSSTDLLNKNGYNHIGLTAWDFTPLESGYYPLVLRVNSVPSMTLDHQIPIAIPKDNSMLQYFRSARIGHTIPSFDVYASGVKTINLEFAKSDPYSYFQIQINGKQSDKIPIDQRVYSFRYDYQSDFSVIVGDAMNQKEKRYQASDLIHQLSVVGNAYYYLLDGKVYTNQNKISGNFTHLYRDQALTKDGKVYQLSTGKVEKDAVIGITLLDQVIPLYAFSYQNQEIATYAYFSTVAKENVTHEKEQQLLIKNGRLSVIDPSLEIDKTVFVVDHYNGKEIQSVLGTDGQIYHLKDSFPFPEKMQNNHIVELTSSLDSESGIMLLRYEDGRIYGMNYRTGEKLFSNNQNTNLSWLDYMKNRFFVPPSQFTSELEEKYEDSKRLEEKLHKKSLEEVTTGKKQEQKTYISVYNATKQTYDLYQQEEILQASSAKSENDKIIQSPQLVDLYLNASLGEKLGRRLDMITIFSFLGGAILISLVIYLRNVKGFWRDSTPKIKT